MALVVRAVELWELADTPLLEFVLGDAKNYVAWGREIAAGDWLGDETFYQAPLYPYFLGVAFSLFGDDLFAVRILQLFVGAASCTLLGLAGHHFFNARTGLAVGLMLAFYAPALYADAMLQKSVLDIFFVCLSLWLVSRLATGPTYGAAMGLGMALGTMMLTRENALVFPVVLVPWLAFFVDAPRRRARACAALFLMGMSLILGPVAIRNWTVGGEFHLTTSQFGHNFYIGNNPASDGTYAPLIAGRGDPRIERLDAIALAENALARTLTPSEVSGFYTQRAFDYIQEQPVDWLMLMFRKVMLVFTSTELVDTEDQYTHAENSRMLSAAGVLFHFGILAPIAALGLFVTWPRRRILMPLYLMFAMYTGTLVVFYVFARYRLPLVPFLVLFAGAAVSSGAEFFSNSPRRTAAMSVGLAATVAVVANWPLLDKSYMRSVTHYNLGNELAGVGRSDEAIDEFQRAIDLYSNNVMANHNLGAMLANRGDLVGARAQYERALAINPSHVASHFNLARVYLDEAKLAQAVAEFDRGLAIEPRHFDVQNEVGEAYARSGDWAAAIARYRAALRLNPGFEKAARNLAEAENQQSGG